MCIVNKVKCKILKNLIILEKYSVPMEIFYCKRRQSVYNYPCPWSVV